MASFAEKVRGPPPSHSSARPHPGTAATPSASEEVEADLVEAISLQHTNAVIHPTRASPNEQLPAGYSRSYGGFLLRQESRIVTVDQRAVRREMDYLSRHIILAFFVGGRPPSNSMPQWLESLQRQVGGFVAIGRNLGRGFFQLRTKDTGIAHKLLTLTPFKSKWGSCVMQNWVANFNADNPRGMKIPTWITLRR